MSMYYILVVWVTYIESNKAPACTKIESGIARLLHWLFLYIMCTKLVHTGHQEDIIASFI